MDDTTYNNKLQFRNAIMGYNKADVDAYVLRVESEMEQHNNQQGRWQKEIEELREKIKQLNETIDTERTEKQSLKNQCDKLNTSIAELEQQVGTLNAEKMNLQQKCLEMQESVDASGANLKTIQDAILNAQRMSEVLIDEAHQRAEEIILQAETDRQEQEEAGKQVVAAAEAEALRVTGAAEEKCDGLQREYDRLLMDVTEFKAELMKMYRRHMEMLATLPEKKISEASQTDHIIEGSFTDVEEEKKEQ